VHARQDRQERLRLLRQPRHVRGRARRDRCLRRRQFERRSPVVVHRQRLSPADRVDTVRRRAYGVHVSAEGPQMPDQLRAEAERHIAEHALGEAERIARLSRIREFVLGAQDGLLVPLGVVTGMAAAHPARSLVIVAGLAEAVAGAISMGGGSYLASQAEEQLYASEIASEGQEIAEFPERETAELALILEREGLERAQAERVAGGLASNPNVFLRTKIEK